jgi:hypothetical protein
MIFDETMLLHDGVVISMLSYSVSGLDCITFLDSLSPRSQQRVESVCDFKFTC